jgi:succinate dehydrogenase / fumarate reductase cytochrome b subunit
MSKSAILSSSIAKKYWMALTGLFLSLFLVGHLVGNLQLIFITGEEGKRAFNEYAYFMTHNPAVKLLSYVTYLSILFHAIDGILLTIQNKKARPVQYAYNNPGANSKLVARQMAVLGSAILLFIILHMSNFWWKMKYSSAPMPLHTYVVYPPFTENANGDTVYYTQNKTPLPKNESIIVKEGTKLYPNIESFKLQIEEAKKMSALQGQAFDDSKYANMDKNFMLGEGYKALHALLMTLCGQSKPGVPTNPVALLAVII